jgi:pyruvate dehydrogenase E1 component beta subunit
VTRYKEEIIKGNERLAKEHRAVFIGYNLAYGSGAYGTLSGVPKDQIIEMPVAEALMTGIAIGMALDGWLPVLIFERHDFMLLAADQIINHLSKIKELSEGQYNPKVVIRAIVGGSKPFDPGIQHLQDFTYVFKSHCSFPVLPCDTAEDIKDAYDEAVVFMRPIMIVEYKGMY